MYLRYKLDTRTMVYLYTCIQIHVEILPNTVYTYLTSFFFFYDLLACTLCHVSFYVLASYTIFSFNIFRIKCVCRWRRRFLTLSRNKWTFKLQRRVPPVVAVATDNECSGSPLPARDKFVPLYLRVYFDAHIARASRIVLAVITTPRRLIHVRSYQQYNAHVSAR